MYGTCFKCAGLDSLESTNEAWAEFQSLVMRQSIQRFLCDEQSCDLVAGQVTTIIGHKARKDATFYGNVGRCLQMKERVADALRCYVYSAEILDKQIDG